jgi:hypothetical protein
MRLIGFRAELRIVDWIVKPNRETNLNKTNIDYAYEAENREYENQ